MTHNPNRTDEQAAEEALNKIAPKEFFDGTGEDIGRKLKKAGTWLFLAGVKHANERFKVASRMIGLMEEDNEALSEKLKAAEALIAEIQFIASRQQHNPSASDHKRLWFRVGELIEEWKAVTK